MRLEPDSPRRTDEQRRYFPDFTPYLLEDCEELEADHNSYLAGGYAEEFGYWAQTGSSRGVPLLDDEPLEQHAKWFGQAGAMHPGYPIKPSPLALDGTQSGGRYTRWPQLAAGRDADLQATRELERHGAFVRVTDRPYVRERHDLAHRAAAVLARFLSALVAASWELPLKHRAP